MEGAVLDVDAHLVWGVDRSLSQLNVGIKMMLSNIVFSLGSQEVPS